MREGCLIGLMSGFHDVADKEYALAQSGLIWLLNDPGWMPQYPRPLYATDVLRLCTPALPVRLSLVSLMAYWALHRCRI